MLNDSRDLEEEGSDFDDGMRVRVSFLAHRQLRGGQEANILIEISGSTLSTRAIAQGATSSHLRSSRLWYHSRTPQGSNHLQVAAWNPTSSGISTASSHLARARLAL